MKPTPEEEQWYKAHSAYQHAVKTERERKIISNQQYHLKNQETTIREFQELLASEMKEHIQRQFAYKLSDEIQRVIHEGISKSGLANPNQIITLQFATSDLRFRTSDQLEKLILDEYINQLPNKLTFVPEQIMRQNEYITYYRIEIDKLIYNYAK